MKSKPGIIIGPCSECKHWTAAEWSFRESSGSDLFRVCARAAVEGAPMFVDADEPRPPLITAADFGCVQWERKD